MTSSAGGVSEDTYVYGTDHRTRGTALVINIMEFDMKGQGQFKGKSRDYTDFDMSNMLFPLNKLGFNVVSVVRETGDYDSRKVSLNTIKQKINAVAQDDHSNADCFLCLVLSFGNHGQVFASDFAFVIEELLHPLKKCPSLAGKPKIFILQTCMQQLSKPTHDGPDQVKFRKATVPAEADFFILWSHIPQRQFPHKGEPGTIFITLLAQHLRVFLKEAKEARKPKEEFVHFCVRVIGSVNQYLHEHYREELEKDGKLLPFFTTMLTKELWLGPKEQS